MRSLSFEQLLLLFILVGIPLLRAMARWLRPRPPTGMEVVGTPPAAADEEEEPPWVPLVLAPESPPPGPPAPTDTAGARAAFRKPPEEIAPPAAVRRAVSSRSQAARFGRALVAGGPSAVHQALVWRTLLGPPRAFDPEGD